MKFICAAAVMFAAVLASAGAQGKEPVESQIDSIASGASAATPTASPPTTTVTGEMGKIVMYRQGAMMGLALGCPIRYRGQEIVELGRNKFAEWIVPAGSYILANKTSSVDVNVFPGQTKYVRCVIKPGFMSGRADLQPVDAETFMEHSADYERKEVSAPILAAGM